MKDTLREVVPGLWVSDIESAGVVADILNDGDLVVDCTGRVPVRPGLIHVPPSGATSHAWTSEDLDQITALVKAKRMFERTVLIHCQSGRSRSTCAAAAAVLALGLADTVEGALAKTAIPGARINTHSLAGLKRWWREKQAARQIPLLARAS